MTRGRIDALDGLRALACVAVLAVHTGHPLAGGGWMGVDVFFVLSGYLITQLLLTEQEGQGRVRLLAFYARRAARLFPALIAAVLLASALALSPLGASQELSAAGVLVALAYVSDLWMLADLDGLGRLGHTWSLAIEEHFYLLWPLVVVACATRRRIMASAMAGAVASFAVLIFWHGSPEGRISHSVAYFAPHARAWELLLGCALACAAPRLRGILSRQALRWIGTGSALLAAATIGSATLVPIMSAWQALAVCLATAGWLLAVPADGAAVRACTAPALGWLGRRSYGVYLYHYPLFGAVEYALGLSRSQEAAIGAVVTVAVAAASFRWLEEPARLAARARIDGRGRLSAVAAA